MERGRARVKKDGPGISRRRPGCHKNKQRKVDLIELRSDTFTLPTAEMLAAIARAPLGDDGYGEDPTVSRLEKMAAARLGKEAACLMPSGTMANLACMMAHCPAGSTALVGDQSDFLIYEDKGLAGCAGITVRP